MYERLQAGQYPGIAKTPADDAVAAEHARQPFQTPEEIRQFVNDGSRPIQETSPIEVTQEEAAKLIQERIAQRRAGQKEPPASQPVEQPKQPVKPSGDIVAGTGQGPMDVKGTLYREDPNARTPSERLKTRQAVDPSEGVVLVTRDQWGKPIPEDTQKARQEFVDNAKPGAEFGIKGFETSGPYRVMDDGQILDTKTGRVMGDVQSRANQVNPGDITWSKPVPPSTATPAGAAESKGTAETPPTATVDAQSQGTRSTPTGATVDRASPAAENEQPTVRPGKVGDMLAAGEVVTTSSGRQTTPFPKIDTGSDRKAQNTIKRVDKWLHENAVKEAKSRGDDFNLTQFSAEDPARLPPASKDAMEEYLFGEQPKVPKPITKPLVAPKAESKWQSETRAKLDAVPALKGSKFDMDEQAGTVKVTRPDNIKITIHFKSDEKIKEWGKKKGFDPEKTYGWAVKTHAGEIGIFVRSDANHTNVLNHEIMHALEYAGIVTKEEVEKYGGREGIAEKYGKWAEAKYRKKDSVFQKIYDALEAVFSSQRKFFEEVGQRQVKQKPSKEETEKVKAAGINIAKTKKGWIVTGLPSDLSQEMRDGIEFEGGRKTGSGYFFKENPTSRLVPTAEAIADENRKSDEAAKAGLVSTPIGVLSQEDADWYRGERQQRLELAKQMLNDANNAVDELLGQFVPSAKRGLFKISLMKAAETGDPNTILRFDEMVDYSINHPELGLPQDESGLFDRLLQSVIQEKDLAKQIDDELATELASDKGDDSFNFGTQQTAIEGLEEDVARQERKDVSEAKQAKSKKQFESDNSKGKQKTFLTDIYGDPTQGTLFDPDGTAEADQTETGVKPEIGSLIKRDGVVGVVTRLKGDGVLAVDFEETTASGRKVSPRYAGFSLVRPGEYTVLGESPFPATLERFYKQFGDKSQEQVAKEALDLWNSLDDDDKSRFAHRLRRFGIAGAKKNSKPETIAESIANVISLSEGVPGKLRQVYDIAMEYPKINQIFDDPMQAKLHREMMQRIDEVGLELPPMVRAAIVFPDMRRELLHDLAKQQFGQEIADSLFEDANVKPQDAETSLIGDKADSSDADMEAANEELDSLMDSIMEGMEDVEAPKPTSKPRKYGNPKSSSPKKSEKTQAKADDKLAQAKQKMRDAFKDTKGKPWSGIDPEVATNVALATKLYIEGGILSFKAFVERLVEDFSESWVRDKIPYLESAWRVANKRGWINSPTGKVEDVLGKAEPEALYTVEGEEGMIARVFKHNDGFSVNVTDTDSGMSGDQVRIFPTLEQAKAHADTIKPPASDYGTVESPNRVELGKYFAGRFAEGASYVRITDARKEAAELIGGTPKDGTSAIKDIDEAVEIGVVRHARDIAQSGLSDSEIYDQLVDLYTRQPNLGTRTSTSMAEQAYSTPAPLAYVVNKRAGVTTDDTVYDSSAGNGMLLIVGGTRYANELNPDRAESLRGQGIETTSEDATEFEIGKPIDALVINPPFGQVKNDAGKPVQWNIDGVRTDKIDHAITLQSLKDIPEDGKVAIIIGAKGFEKREPKADSQRGVAYLGEKKFYDTLYDNYNVVDHFTVHGDLYSRQGASFPVDVIIVQGKGKSQRPKPYNITGGGIPSVIKTWEELKDAKLRSITGASSASTRGNNADDSASVGSGNAIATSSDAKKPSSKSSSGRVGGKDRGVTRPEGLGQPSGQPGVSNTTDGKKPTSGKSDGNQSGRTNPRQRNADRPSGPDSGDRLKPDETAETSYQVSYRPGSNNASVDTLIPRNHQSAVTKSLESVADIYGDIDEFVASELGYSMDELADAFSAEQVDALALAIARHKDGGAFIIGDQTGVGKGRAAAAMMVYANRQGLIPVFVTEKPTLYADMVRDLIDIGRSTEDSPFNVLMTNSLSGKDVVPLPDGRSLKQSPTAAQKNLANAVKSVLDGGVLSVEGKGKNAETVEYNAIFTTYSQLQPVKQIAPERFQKLKSISDRSFYILDESHNAGGGADSDPNANQERRSNGQEATVSRAELVRDLIGTAAGVYFSSATYAKRSQTMGLYARTGMTAATNNDAAKLSEAIATGGVPLQQVVSEQLVESGMYLRRERSFDGVEFAPKTVGVDLSNLDNVSAIFNAINTLDKYAQDAIKELQDEITSAGGAIRDTEATGQAGIESTSFSSILHNLVDQMLLAVKADAVADETIASIKAGESPVIYVDSTLEAALKRQVDDMNVNTGDEIDFSYRDLVRRYLERSREYTVRRDLEDADSVERVRLTDDQLGPAGVAAYERAMDMIAEFEGNMPASPIDWIRKRVNDAGYSIGEITGRQVVLEYGNDGKVRLGKRPDEEAGAGGRTATVAKFNAGEIDSVLINQSGSTGISMHASEKFKNQKPRHMIIGQPSRNIDTFMQALGRVHRTGQVVLPRFTLMMTDAPAEIRPASVLVKKLASLNANVTASAKGSVSFDVPDVINIIGDQIVAEYLADNPALDLAIGEIVSLRSDGTPRRNPGIAKKASGRMALRPVAEQQLFWDSVVASYNELVDELNRIGKNPLVAATLDLQAKTLESTTIFEGDATSANAFLQPASIELVRANKPGSPMTSSEVTEAITTFYGKPVTRSVAIEWLRATQKEVQEAYAEYSAAQTKDLSGEELATKQESLEREGNRRLTNLMNRLQEFAPGMAVSVYDKNGDGSVQDVVPGFVTKVKRSKGGNPLASSKWSIEVAIASPDRVAKSPLSRTGEQQPEGIEGYREFLTNNELINDKLLKEFEETDSSPTEQRYIGVGNILAAYSQLGKAGGQITFFTDANGNVRRGVLMPRSFNVDQWADARPVVLDTVQDVRQFLASGSYLNTPDKALNLMMIRGDLVLRAPKAKSRGGKYTLNSAILSAAAPLEFVSIGSRMEMVVQDKTQQDAVLSAVMSVASMQADSDKNLARQIKAASESLRNQSGDTDTDVLYQNVDPQIVVQATDLAIDAQDAGIDSFDELVAFSVKTVGEQRTRDLGQYLAAAGDMLGLKGIRPIGDVIGMPGVSREQAMVMAKAAFPMLTDEQIESGLDIQDATAFGRDQVGFAPLGTPAPGMSQSQRDKGNVKGWTQFISATRAIIGATSKADVSTFIHELFHPMRKFLLDRKIPAESRAGITDEDIKALEDYAGAKDGKWTVEAEEKAAKAWEQYWFEGKSPTTALRSLFEKLARWMREVYRGVHQITGGQLPAEVRQLFDKIVQRGGISEQEVPQDDNLTSIKNEVMNDLRAQRGLPELADVAAQTQQEWIDTAESRMRAEPGIADRLVKAINANPRNLSNIEVAILQLHYRHVNNELASVSDRLFEAKDAGDALEAAKVQREVDLVMNALAEIEDASKAAGREWGRAGVSRQIVLRKDFSLAGIMRKARIANAGNALSAEQQAEMIELAKRVAELEGKLAKAEQEKLDLERQRNIERTLEEEKKRPPVVRTTARKKASDAVSAFKQKFASVFSAKSSDTLLQTEDELMAEAAQEVVEAYVKAGVFSFGEFIANVQRDTGGDLPTRARVAFATAWEDAKMMGEIPTPEIDVDNVAGMTRLARRIQRSLVEAGITDREKVVDAVHESLQEIVPDITRRETMDALSGYGQYSRLSQDDNDKIIRDINGQLQQLAKLEDMRSGQAPSKTGGERRTPSDEERRLIKEVNEAKRRGGFVVTDPQAQLRTAMDAAKTAVRNRISDLEYEIQNRQRIVRTKTELTPDPELDSLRKRRDALLDVHKTLFPKQGATMEQRIAAANRAIDASIADLEERLKTGNVMPIGRKAPVSTPELEAKRARLKALQEQRDAIRALANPKMTPEERSERAYKASLLKRLADYQERMANSEFTPRPKKELRVLTPEQLQLKKQLEDVKDQFFQKAADYRLANMSPAEKAWDYVKETSHLSRAIMTSFDLSAVFRQGGVGSLAHPVLAAETSRDMLRAIMSSQAEFDIAEGIRNDPMYQFAMTAKLAITEEDGKITRQEEAFMGRWARHGIGKTGSKINAISQKALAPVAMSARAYTTFLNGMRFKLFKHMVASLGVNGQVTADEAKVIAQYVNVATGRADLGKYNQAMANLNVLFFAPRYVASRFQFFALPFYLLPSKNVSLRVKKTIAKEYARYAIGLGTFLATAVALGSLLFDDDDEDKPTVEFDPRSSDFGKIKIGETRIDPMSGFSQVVTVVSQVITGRKKGADGEIQHLRGEGHKWGSPTTWDVMASFARKKFAPIPSAATNVITGENVVGDKVTPLTATRDLFIPLSVSEVKETMQARGVPAGSAITILTLLGMGGGTYGPKTKFANGTKEEREQQLEKDLQKMEWDSPDLPYRDLLNEEQYQQMIDRREERKQDLAYAATALPVHNKGQSKESFEKEVAAHQEAMDAVLKAGWSEEFVRQLLRDYAKTRGNKEAVVDRIRRIKRIFSKTSQ